MKNPMPRIQMLDGFNQGWIEFEGGEAQSRKGRVTLDTVLLSLIDRTAPQPKDPDDSDFAFWTKIGGVREYLRRCS